MADRIGHMAEVHVGLNEHVEAGQPIWITTTQAQLASSNAAIAEAESARQQVLDELETKTALRELNADVVPTREIERLEVVLQGRTASVDAAQAAKDALETQITVLLPA